MKETFQSFCSFIAKHPCYGLVLWIFVLHRPAILHFGNAIPGSQQGDTIRGHWSAWLMSVDATPLNSIFFNWPDGGSLLPLPPISLWLVSPITSLFGAAVGLSALILLHTVLLTFSGYLLARSVEMEQKPSIAMSVLVTLLAPLPDTHGVIAFLLTFCCKFAS